MKSKDKRKRKCSRCLTIMSLDDFYSDRTRPLNKSYECKVCDRIRHQTKKRKSYLKEYRKTAHYKEIHKKSSKNYILRFALRQKARFLVKEAIKKGLLKKPIHCLSCQSLGKIEGHHKDYSKPLQVDWLCVQCHKKEHILHD